MGLKLTTLPVCEAGQVALYWVEFEKKPFNGGSSRHAFKGIYNGIGPRVGHPCVVKVFKDGVRNDSSWDTDLKASIKAEELSRIWNCTNSPMLGGTIEFVIPLIAQVESLSLERCSSSSGSSPPILPHECLAIEEFLYGNYVKFNDNETFENPALSTEIPLAFGHWTYQYSAGQLMVCDLQGVKQFTPGGVKYHLTDPAIHSLDQIYGITDKGKQGMMDVLNNHVCNDICRFLQLKPLYVK